MLSCECYWPEEVPAGQPQRVCRDGFLHVACPLAESVSGPVLAECEPSSTDIKRQSHAGRSLAPDAQGRVLFVVGVPRAAAPLPYR